MYITGFAHLELQHVRSSDLIGLYAEWITGTGEFAGKRKLRLASGVPIDLDVAQISRRVEYRNEEKGCSLRTRSMQDRWICHWIHIDSSEGDKFWNNTIEIRLLDKGDVSFTHVTGWSSTDPEKRSFQAAPPSTLPKIIERYGNHIREPKEVSQSEPVTIMKEDVKHFLKHVLLNPNREQPVLLVTPFNANDRYPVNPAIVQKNLIGACMVAVMDSAAASIALSKEMTAQGFDRKAAVSNGAARMYFKGLSKETSPYDSPLVFVDPRLHWKPASGFLSGFAISQFSKRIDQSSWLDIISRFDRQEFRERVSKLLTVGVEQVQPDLARESQLEDQILESEITNDELKEKLKSVREELLALEGKLRHEFALREQGLLDELELAKAISEEDQKLLDKRFNEINELNIRVSVLEQQAQESARAANAVAIADRDLIEVLALCGSLFPNLVIHERAERGCADSVYRNPEQLFLVLSMIATMGDSPYLGEHLVKRLGVKAAKWRGKDSPETLKTFKVQRKYTSRITGKESVMSQHITIGGGLKEERNIQIYFEPASDGRIEILYVGKHLPTTSHDT